MNTSWRYETSTMKHLGTKLLMWMLLKMAGGGSCSRTDNGKHRLLLRASCRHCATQIQVISSAQASPWDIAVKDCSASSSVSVRPKPVSLAGLIS